MKLNKNMGFLLLSIWLILMGVSQLMTLPIPSLDVILGALAVVSGVFILMGK
jgi:FtsH-binding integral membrane protein